MERCAETKWRARGEFLRAGTVSSNPSLSSKESANFRSLVEIGCDAVTPGGTATSASADRPYDGPAPLAAAHLGPVLSVGGGLGVLAKSLGYGGPMRASQQIKASPKSG